ncbi:MAG: hypothetical protein GEU97_21095, partial [Actinophytocola sp.]|nr:hypothetical protein [Actinophytocola sp.]
MNSLSIRIMHLVKWVMKLGDDSFADFCRRYRGRIFGYVRARGRGELSTEDIEDATQVTLMRLWTMWGRVDP